MKSLRITRKSDRRARGDEVLRRALEEGSIGQHRQAGRPAFGVGAGESRRVEVGPDQALRRARLLDLGDERRPAGGNAPLDRSQKAARWRSGGGAALDLGRWHGGFRGRDLGPLARFDPGENVSHPITA